MSLITVGQLVSAAIVILLILLQQRSSGMGGGFLGASSMGGEFYQRRRGIEKMIFIATIVSAVTFVGLSIVSLLQ
ncbi:MAG: preprotein translocase subunit SecG [Candidatus Colwellbacteria bacterium]|nr:preprotein translocase subunit SecG [Candidatus Colwellbacteria bacterium]